MAAGIPNTSVKKYACAGKCAQGEKEKTRNVRRRDVSRDDVLAVKKLSDSQPD